VAGITGEFDSDIRQGNAGYAGAGAAPDVGADEFEHIGTGACCLASGCQEITTSQCLTSGGVYRGDNITCAAANCTPPGACCTNGVCAIKIVADCTSGGGYFRGEGSLC